MKDYTGIIKYLGFLHVMIWIMMVHAG